MNPFTWETRKQPLFVCAFSSVQLKAFVRNNRISPKAAVRVETEQDLRGRSQATVVLLPDAVIDGWRGIPRVFVDRLCSRGHRVIRVCEATVRGDVIDYCGSKDVPFQLCGLCGDPYEARRDQPRPHRVCHYCWPRVNLIERHRAMEAHNHG